MKQKESINTEVLVELVNRLAEISKWIAGEQPGLDAAYEKYQAFYIPVSAALKDFGIRLEYNGYAYILEAVRIIVDRNTFDIRLKTDVYPFPKDFAFFIAWGEIRMVTVCFFRSSRFISEILLNSDSCCGVSSGQSSSNVTGFCEASSTSLSSFAVGFLFDLRV